MPHAYDTSVQIRRVSGTCISHGEWWTNIARETHTLVRYVLILCAVCFFPYGVGSNPSISESQLQLLPSRIPHHTSTIPLCLCAQSPWPPRRRPHSPRTMRPGTPRRLSPASTASRPLSLPQTRTRLFLTPPHAPPPHPTDTTTMTANPQPPSRAKPHGISIPRATLPV
ncbi:hypothetical protein BZA05DRAFT_382686 [Tricharina praecox]|uniref:uncharacterized protein n=1 Tax=Tricharina praecox TaxID=43433 RepID=UPI00221F7177|nr:uncharacterized protein BZA05DRAFT_382686 [Tricharina praecox]KAI5858887.1 hypothetical protein BZA05DRAFT_382686 [Tricharina praecox]